MRRRPSRGLLAVFVAALVTGTLLVLALLYLRGAALHEAEKLTASLSQVIAEQTARTLQSVDQALRLTLARLPEPPGALAAHDAHQAQLQAELQAELQQLPFVQALFVIDADGTMLLHTHDRGLGTSMADRPYVRVFREGAASGLFIGPLLRSRFTGRWLMTMARPLRAADGSLRAVVGAAVEPPYFEHLWHGIDLGDTGAVSLYNRDGQLLMRSPADETLLGKDFSSLPLFTRHLREAPHGLFEISSRFDGLRRMVGYRALPTYPQLVVGVGLGRQEVLAPWRRFAALAAAVWLLAVAAALTLTLQLGRQSRARAGTQERFRQLAQAVPQIVFIADAEGRVQFVNQRWEELTGHPADHALGFRWEEYVPPEERTPMRQQLAAGLAVGEQLEFEHRLRAADGSYRWQLLRAVPVREEGGQGVSWIGTATDIHELKGAQHRLHEQAEQLRLGGRLTRMGGWRAEVANRRVWLSPEAAAVLDLPPGVEPELAAVLALLTEGSREPALQAIRACAQQGQPFDIEVQAATHTGRAVWVRTIGEPVWDADGQVVAIQGAQQDITLRVLMMDEIRRLNAGLEERIAERTAQLARQEALFRTLAEQAPLPFWTVDLQGRITFLSRAWYELVGGAPPEWHGGQWRALIHPDDLAGVQRNWVRSARSGEAYAGTRRIRARDGSYHTTSYRAVPVRGAQGEVLFWVGVDSDITDLMANEAALRLANKQLEAFSYSVSHDLQSPLQRVASYAQLLQQALAHGPAGKAQHYLARIQANADTMAQLIEGLLALAHVSQLEVIRAPVNLSDMATEILQRHQAEDPQRRVRWQVQPGLAATGDVRLLRSVMENLIGNAWKFTGGRSDPEIAVGAAAGGEFFVRDNGCGFDMAYADRLFTTFQRLHGADEFPGTGIGLATVARAISRQGGRIWAQAVPGEGATFHFTLPPA